MSKKIIGIDLGGTSIKFAILTLDGEVQEKWSIKTNILDEGSHIVDDMIESIAHRLKMLEIDASEFQGIGMGSPGVVDREKGTVIGAYNLNWKTLQPIKEKIEKALGIPFFIDNDANVAALGERWKGAGENQPDVVFMTLGTGVGGGSSLKVVSCTVYVELLVSLVTSLLTLTNQSHVPVVKKAVLRQLLQQQGLST